MGNCNNCCKCFRQADGSIVKRSDRATSDSKFAYELVDGTITEVAPANFITTEEVSCGLFDSLSSPPKPAAVLEVVDGDGNQIDNQLVRLIDYPDGTTKWRDLKTGTEYDTEAEYLTAIGNPNGTTHTSEDTDYNERTVIICDEGVDVIATIVYRDGKINDVVSTTVTSLDGSVHTLSGNEKSGTCSDLMSTDKEVACFKETGNVDGVIISGYIIYSTDSSVTPSVTTSAWYDDNDVIVEKATHTKVECC
jgi:hypothetical protein